MGEYFQDHSRWKEEELMRSYCNAAVFWHGVDLGEEMIFEGQGLIKIEETKSPAEAGNFSKEYDE